jgi:hypothetical protein
MNLFDGLRDRAFDITTKVMGYDASWGGHTARVHFRRPDEKDMLMSGVEFSPTSYIMQYREPFFPNLYNAARGGNNQTVVVDGVSYYTRMAVRIHDGETVVVELEKIESPMP